MVGASHYVIEPTSPFKSPQFVWIGADWVEGYGTDYSLNALFCKDF